MDKRQTGSVTESSVIKYSENWHNVKINCADPNCSQFFSAVHYTVYCSTFAVVVVIILYVLLAFADAMPLCVLCFNFLCIYLFFSIHFVFSLYFFFGCCGTIKTISLTHSILDLFSLSSNTFVCAEASYE